VIDGACEHASCVDPADEDDDGHGTREAGTIAAAINGLGVAGVAPKVTLVNIRAGQDSGVLFLQPTIDALTYAGSAGIDVVNMSFFTDPWLYNCLDNPADSPAEQAEQRTVREATQRALDFARANGVLPIAALGNEATDIGNPTVDDTSPDFPLGRRQDPGGRQLLHHRPDRVQRCRRGLRARSQRAQVLLLQLRRRADRRVGTRR
jgi:subtilisin family serine protease